jgi:hypothetical protein
VRKLHNEELHDLYSSPNIVRVIKAGTMKWSRYVARIQVLVEKLRERDHLEDTGVDGRIILRWIFRNWDVGAWTGWR